MKKRLLIVIILLVVIFGGVFGWDYLRIYFTKQFMANFQPPPVSVSTATASSETWQPTLPAVGTLMAINGVDVNSQVPGQIVSINFKSGQFVEKGRPLVQLDDSVDQQTLLKDEAQLRLAEVNYERQLSLYKRNVAAKSSLDTAQADLAASQAAVATARVQIDRKHIKAPFAGKLGIRQVNLGQYIQPGDALVTLQALDPLFVDFTMPEQLIKQIKVDQPITVAVTAYPDQLFHGKVTAITSKIDVDTRNFTVRGTIPNPQHILFPGTFASVEVILPEKQNVITVPQTAVTYSLYGDSIYVVEQAGKDNKPQLKVRQAFVSVGAREGNRIAIDKGIKVGDQVVTSGQLKLHPGAVVTINNTVKLN